MIKNVMIIAFLASLSLSAHAQSANELKYLVRTHQPELKEQAKDAAADSLKQEMPEPVDSMKIWFPHVSLCEWTPGMRFMVIPDKKDLIVKSFADANTGAMVSTQSLRHKVLIYNGHDGDENHKDSNSGLHERIYFTCEEDGRQFFFEVPTRSFDDYCYTKAGVPSLVYLGDVDVAMEKLMGKTVLTLAHEYYIDIPSSADGCDVVLDIPVGTEAKVVAVGAGTRSFPVKIIVKEETKDGNGREFFQNVAISRTNCGMRDEEFDISNMKIHTFDGSFELADDSTTVGGIFQKYARKDVYTIIATEMEDMSTGVKVHIKRLTPLHVKSLRSQRDSEYAKMTLVDKAAGKTYTKNVLLISKNKIGITDRQREDYADNIFALGNPKTLKGVEASNWTDLQNGVVRNGFTETEVRLALGEPTTTGRKGANPIWVYKQPGKSRATVEFNNKTHKVISVDR